MGKILVELCAGSAAVSLRWLRSDARPPLAYQGGKRGYADQILTAMGLQPGGGARGGEVVLVEPGPWGEAWDLWRAPAGRADTIERLRAWQEEDPRTLWERLRAAPVPADAAERVAVWTVLQPWNWAGKPIIGRGGAWKTHGYFRGKPPSNRPNWAVSAYSNVDGACAALAILPDLSRVTVLRCSALDVAPIPGAVVYIDPPYSGTTCAYGHDLPRDEVLNLAERWEHSGASLVAVSEAEAVPIAGWSAVPVDGSDLGCGWSKQRREVLTLSRPPAGQMGLLERACG